MILSDLLVLLLAVISNNCSLTNGYKILIEMSTMSRSHLMYGARIGEVLVEAGHNVTLYMPFINKDVKNWVEGGQFVTNCSILAEPNGDMGELFDDYMKVRRSEEGHDAQAGTNIFGTIQYIYDVYNISVQIASRNCIRMFCSYARLRYFLSVRFGIRNIIDQLKNKKQIEEIRAMKFDVMLGHVFSICPLLMNRQFDIDSFIWYSSAALIEPSAIAFGVPTTPSYIPGTLADLSDEMTFAQRMRNFIGSIFGHCFFYFASDVHEKRMVEEHLGSSHPTPDELTFTLPQLIFVNSEELFDFARPITHQIVYIGGLEVSLSKPLDQKWASIMEEAIDGVVLFSFGSLFNTDAMAPATRLAFIDAFARFPTYKFIWKVTSVFDTGSAKNIYMSTWMPQGSILDHSKTKAFITHGGYSSIMEAVYCGVPMITVPLAVDQYRNSRIAEKRQVSFPLSKANISADSVYSALSAVLFDQRYKEAAANLAKMLKKKPNKSKELIVKWTEFVAEFKRLPHLRSSSIHLSFIEYFLIDVIAVGGVSIALALYLSFRIVKCYYWVCCQVSKKRNSG